MTGGGSGRLVSFGPERIEIELAGTTSETRVVLHVADYPCWRASQGGRDLTIAPAPIFGAQYPLLMEVSAGDGRLVFDYVRRAPDWAGLALTMMALAALAVAAARRRFPAPARAAVAAWSGLQRPLARRRWRVVIAGAAALLAASVTVRALRSPLLPPESLFTAAPRGALSLGGEPCAAVGATAWRCGPHDLRAHVVAGFFGAHLCMSGPTTVGPLVYETRRRLGRFLTGNQDPPDGGGRVTASIDGQPLGEAPATSRQGQLFFQFDTRAFEGREGLLRVTVEGAALYCFDVEMVK